MLDTYRIERRIKEVHKRVKFLVDEYRNLTEEEFVKDDMINASAERNLQVAIQACIDIANHIVASLGLDKKFDSTAEVFYELVDNGILDGDFANKMASITGYRNVLVDAYLDVQRKITYDNIQNRLSDLSEFAKYIEEFLGRYEKKHGTNSS